MGRQRKPSLNGHRRAVSDLEPQAASLFAQASEALNDGCHALATGLLRACIDADPKYTKAWIALGAALKTQDDIEGADQAYMNAINLRPDKRAAYMGLAETRLKKGLLTDALAACQKALALTESKSRAPCLTIVGRILCDMKRFDEATAALAEAIRLKPNETEAHFVLGLVCESQGKPLAAFHFYQTVIALQPRDVRAYNNIAAVLVSLGQLDLAISTARIAVALAPNHPAVYLNLATALRLKGDHDDSFAMYRRVLDLDPNHGEALVELCQCRQHACDWDGLGEQQERSRANSYRKGALVSPFSVMTSTDLPIEQLLCAHVWGRHLAAAVDTPLAPYAPRPLANQSRRIKVGYLSADFHSHATAMLIVDMLEQHDRSRFEIFGYSIGPDDGSAMRRRLVDAFESFVDLRDMSDPEAAQRIRADEIDILLDLKGYTQDARIRILAYKPAPIQINYLGFPGTMGAPFIDYIIADRHVAPMKDAGFFQEKIIHLSHCYQPNDRRRGVAKTPMSRTEHGLPESGFVFCCFNSPYKITPVVFDIWMRLLAKTPGSVLWLLAPKQHAVENLRREAAVRFVDPTRLVFAPFVAPDLHLARLRLADLFLDTTPVNAHTTASEALWVGLPLLTCPGQTFASRVASSLLHAIDMPELVAGSLVSYEEAALKLAHDEKCLAVIRNRLRTNQSQAPLFDTLRYTRDFEAALEHVVVLRDQGRSPEAFALGVRT